MSLTLEYFYNKTKEKYKLSLLTDNPNLSKQITWVYLLEDISNCSFIRKGELIITTGLAIKTVSQLYSLIEAIYSHGACGIIFNTGTYISKIPDEITNLGNKLNFPIFCMPWEIHIADIMHEYCNEIISEEKTFEKMNSALKTAITTDINNDTEKLLNQFKSFYLIASYNELKILYYAFAKVDNVYYYICSKDSFSKLERNIGISNLISDVHLMKQYQKQAFKALMVSVIKQCNTLYFSEIGLYDIALSIHDPDVLLSARTLLLPVANADLRATFRCYLECNCSVQTVADKMFVHRNTINYRIRQIEQILNTDISMPENRLKYLLAFYLHDCLQLYEQNSL